MSEKEREIQRLRHRIEGLEKTLKIVTGHSGRIEKNLKQLFEAVSDTLPVPLLITAKTGEFLFCNENARQTFGYSHDGFKKINAAVLYENVGDRKALLKAIGDQSEVRGFSVRMKKADGRVFPAVLFSRQIIFEGQKSLLSVIYDLSELKKEEDKRLMLERQLRQTRKMEAIGAMAGGIAHDFNNILSIIYGNLEMMMMTLPEESDAGRRVDSALMAAKQGREVVMQLLAFCRREDGRQQPLSVERIAADTLKMIRSMTPSSIEIRFHAGPGSSMIMGDPVQIQQVLLNLCTNAYYVLRDRGGKIEVLIEPVFLDSPEAMLLSELRPGAYVRLTVKDNGPGMDRETVDRIFEPFFTTKPEGEGTGMGLAVVHGILQRHCGAVMVESEIGTGTAFHCYFPRVDERPFWKRSGSECRKGL